MLNCLATDSKRRLSFDPCWQLICFKQEDLIYNLFILSNKRIVMFPLLNLSKMLDSHNTSSKYMSGYKENNSVLWPKRKRKNGKLWKMCGCI